MGKGVQKETFEDFIKSFFYGKRSDLSFKFMSDFSEESAAGFLQDLFHDIMDTIDDKDVNRLKQRMISGQVQGYREQKNFAYEEGPFHHLQAPVSDLKLSLLTSSGHFVENDDPKPLGKENMTQKEAESRVFEFLKEEPFLSEIPFDTDSSQLRVRHGGYDIRAAQKDSNVSFPFETMKAVKEEGLFFDLSPNAYSFVGACSQNRLIKKTLPGWVEKMKAQKLDAVVLVPV
jgi:hypothetical protein